MAKAEKRNLAYLFRLRTTKNSQTGTATAMARLTGRRPARLGSQRDRLRSEGRSRQRGWILLRIY